MSVKDYVDGRWELRRQERLKNRVLAQAECERDREALREGIRDWASRPVVSEYERQDRRITAGQLLARLEQPGHLASIAKDLARDGVVVGLGQPSTKSYSEALDSLGTLDRANANKAARCDRIVREIDRRRESSMRLKAIAAQVRLLESREQGD